MFLFSIVKKDQSTCINVVGMKLFESSFVDGVKRKSFLGGFLRITRERDGSWTATVLGVPIYKKTLPITQSQINRIIRRVDDIYFNMQILAQVPIVHKYFTRYRGCNIGKDVALIAGGPTVRYFDHKKSKAIKCGVNGITALIDNLDYLFVEDTFIHDKNLNNEIDHYVGNNCQKFYGILPQRRVSNLRRIHCTDVIKPINIYQANANVFLLEDVVASKWATYLEVEAFGDFLGAALSALQFIVYTRPKRIFLVGNDCSCEQLAYKSKRPQVSDHSVKIKYYQSFKQFASSVCPEIEIISINPVGLKGIFRDVYTKSYLAEHPEIDPKTVEIIDK